MRGTPCYVVAFEPREAREPVSLFQGRAWIAADDFGIVRIAAAQTGLRGPVVSSEQTDDFVRTPEGAWVLARSDIRSLYQGAAYRTPIHRVVVLDTHVANAADFVARRAAAYDSDHVMLRDTPSGLRYLERDARRSSRPAAVDETAGTPRPVSGIAERRPPTYVRTLAFGVLVDPNISEPLPFAGLSYLDFNLFGTGTQLNAFFGGTLRSAGVLRAVGRWDPVACGGSGARDCRVVQRSGVRRRPRAVRQESGAASRIRRRSGRCGR